MKNRDYDQELINSTRPQHELNDKLDFWSQIAIVAGGVMLLTVMWYLGAVTDAIIQAIEITM